MSGHLIFPAKRIIAPVPCRSVSHAGWILRPRYGHSIDRPVETVERSTRPAAFAAADICRVLLRIPKRQRFAGQAVVETVLQLPWYATSGAGQRPLGKAVEIRIRDNGTGIPPEVREKMFNPFFTTKPTGEGTGLGLSMTHDIIVKQHGGRIDVETEPGEFTEFIIVLPRGDGTVARKKSA